MGCFSRSFDARGLKRLAQLGTGHDDRVRPPNGEVYGARVTASAQEIVARLAATRTRIEQACARADRATDSVLLLAVSKAQPAEAIRAAYEAGQRDFGENYVQELVSKAESLQDLSEIRWHYIGRLQRNKARDVARIATSVHVVDRGALAHALDRKASEAQRKLDVLLEVNLSGELQKGGCQPAEIGALLEEVASCHALTVAGLMTVPPFSNDPEASRTHFAALRALRDEHVRAAPTLTGLSMGMSGDYPVAIEEGATIVRVGTAIFGARAPKAALA